MEEEGIREKGCLRLLSQREREMKSLKIERVKERGREIKRGDF